MKKLSLVLVLLAAALTLAACAAAPETIVETVIVEEVVEVEGEAVVQEVVVTATPEPEAAQIEIFHWWTGPGEREAADAMFAALADKYPDIEVVEDKHETFQVIVMGMGENDDIDILYALVP